MDYRDIVVLAKTKVNDKYYVSGMNTKTREWVRLVSEYEEGKIGPVDIEDLTYLDDREVELLDMIRIPVKQTTVETFQPENLTIDDRYYISRIGKCEHNYLSTLVSTDKIIFNNYSNVLPKSDRRNEEFKTLMFIKPEVIYVKVSNLEKRRLKADIKYDGATYTDFPIFDERFTSLYFENVVSNPSEEVILRDVELGVSLSKANANNEHLKILETVLVSE